MALSSRKRYGWNRIIYNCDEPANRVLMIAEDRGDQYVAIGMSALCRFRDGFGSYQISKVEDYYQWNNNGEMGIAESFNAAWNKLSGLITHPDSFEDSEVFQLIP